MTRPELDAIEAQHCPAKERKWHRGQWRNDLCRRCKMVHPCPTHRLVAELRDREEKLEAWSVQYDGWTPEEHDEFLRILKGGE